MSRIKDGFSGKLYLTPRYGTSKLELFAFIYPLKFGLLNDPVTVKLESKYPLKFWSTFSPIAENGLIKNLLVSTFKASG